MKLILLHLLSLLCLSHQKGEINKGDINKGADDVKKFIDKMGWFKSKNPIIIKINENNVINSIEKEAMNTPELLPVTANEGKESISSSSLSPMSPENSITLENSVDQIKDIETGIIQPSSKSNDVDKVGEALIDSLVQAGQASISEVSNSADEILQQPLVKSGEIIQESSAIVTGTDTGTTGQQIPIPETLMPAASTLPITTTLGSLKIQTITDESIEKPNLNGLSPAVTIQSQLSPSIQQANPTAIQLQASVPATIPMEEKPKQIYPGSEVKQQIQQTAYLRSNNDLQPIQFLIPPIQIQVPQFQNGGFMFGNIFNLIPQIQQAIPQIQQVLPQFVPPIIYPVLPKVLTPILPPVVSNILFPKMTNPQEKNN